MAQDQALGRFQAALEAYVVADEDGEPVKKLGTGPAVPEYLKSPFF